MLVENCAGVIKEGDMIRVCEGAGNKRIIKGEVGEIKDGGFYVWQNKRKGAAGNKPPSIKGYSYSWYIGFKDVNTEISIIRQSEVEGEKYIKEARDVIKKHKK